MTAESLSKKKRSHKGDRILLSAEALNSLEKFDELISSAFGNTVKVSHRDKIHFLLIERSQEFSAVELGKLRSRYFNEVKALKMAIDEVKLAKSEGRSVTIDEILKKITAPQVIEKRRTKRPRAARSKGELSPATPGEELKS